jgi:glutamate N-acetyltransferase/amino-acid N-acetyltransferase
MGYAQVEFDPYKVDLHIESDAGSVKLAENGLAADYSEDKASEILSSVVIKVTADIHSGEAEATAWGCDFSYDYVKINADYRS